MELACDTGGQLVQIKDEHGEPGPWIPRNQWDSYQSRQTATPSRYGSTSGRIRFASNTQHELAIQMLDYVREKQPLVEPTGAAGKVAQAAWREQHGLAYIDPMASSLSTWTSCLAYNGLIRQRTDGSWVATDAVIPERLKKPSKGYRPSKDA